MHVPVVWGDKTIVALVDTGSAVTVVPRRIARVAMSGAKWNGSSVKLTALGRQSVPVAGEVSVALEIGGQSFSACVLVIDDAFALSDMLVGRDVLRQGSVTISPEGEIHLRKTVMETAGVGEALTVVDEAEVGSTSRVVTTVGRRTRVPKRRQTRASVSERTLPNRVVGVAGGSENSLGTSGAATQSPPQPDVGRALVRAPDVNQAVGVAGGSGDSLGTSGAATHSPPPTDVGRMPVSAPDVNRVVGVARGPESPPNTRGAVAEWPPLPSARVHNKPNVTTAQSDPIQDWLRDWVCLTVDAQDGIDIENPQTRAEVQALINAYAPVRPETSLVVMKLQLSDDVPIHRSPRRLAPAERVAVATQIDEWLLDGTIQHSRSPYASPIVVVKKKDGSNRLCVDYRELNAKVIKDRYPLPIIEDVLESFADSSVYTTLDLRNGFFHVDVHPDSRKFTAFVTPDGQYEFRRVPFGLCNSPAVFQRYVNMAMGPLVRDGTVTVYMDDLIVAGRSEEENVAKLRKVLKVAEQHGMSIRFDKCQFVRRRVTFLGHILQDGTVSPSEDKTAAVREYPQPRNVKQIQAFLGLAGFFRKFVPGFSAVAKPLTDLTKKDEPFMFGSKQVMAFEALKSALVSEPVLQLYSPDLETELHTDASISGYGAALMQKRGVDWHPVMYLSFKTSSAEQRYSSYELEVLAVIKALKKLRVYLLGLQFRIVTDCKAFTQTMEKKDICPKVARWALCLGEFDCSVVHRAGTGMRHVDALSRYPVLALEAETDDGLLARVKSSQLHDEHCGLIREVLESGKEYRNHELRREVLYRFVDGAYQLVVPRSMQSQVIRVVHEKGHFGAKQMAAVVQRDYYIEQLGEKCARVVANCVRCILATEKAGKREGMLHPIDRSHGPLHTYHIDHLGPMPSTAKAYRHLLVVVDGFTKYVWLYPVANTGVAEVLKKLGAQQQLFGTPARIVSDRGAAFTSHDFREFCESRQIRHVLTTTGVPRGNGQVERINGIVVPALTKMSLGDPLKWYQHVGALQRYINASRTRSTGETPFKLMFGVEMRNPEDQRLAELIDEAIREEFINERDGEREAAKRAIERIQEENRKLYAKKRKPPREYAVGDLVAIRKTQFAQGAKVQPRYCGPYQVLRKTGPERYEVLRVGGDGPGRTLTAADYMKPWMPADKEPPDDEGLGEDPLLMIDPEPPDLGAADEMTVTTEADSGDEAEPFEGFVSAE